MNATKTRGAVYGTAFITGAASLVAAFGYGTFDFQTGVFDLGPINLYAAIPLIGSVGASGLAAVAVAFGWGRK